ncbi:MAG: UbiD family decarboxylase [Burkholderiales bacterium]
MNQTESKLDYDGLRSLLSQSEALGEVRVIKHADWNLEIGALTETVAELIPEPPALMFDEIKDYPAGFRVLSLATGSRVRMALAFGMAPDTPKVEILRQAARRLRDAPAVAPRVVKDGPVLRNVMRGDEVDLYRFPSLFAHRKDGGRYIGTGSTVLNRDPESGYVNMGTYRLQVHDKNTLGLWNNPGANGRTIAERYWKEGRACPIAATFGGDPVVVMLAYTKASWGVPELDRAGGVRGHPIDVIEGPLTGLPIPIHSEIVIEGEVPPPSEEARDEGPFGEYTGYYSGGTLGTGKPQPVIRVKAIYYRDNPIILNMSPQWPGAPHHSVRFEGGLLWDQLDAAGVPGLTGVYVHTPSFIAVAIKQQYAGHARQAGLAVLGCAAASRMSRFVVVVDEDIDPSNMKEVMWAMTSRCEPGRDIEIIENCPSGPLDVTIPPEMRAIGNWVSSRAIMLAVRPWAWREKFPMVNRIDRDQREAMVAKYKAMLPFPAM